MLTIIKVLIIFIVLILLSCNINLILDYWKIFFIVMDFIYFYIFAYCIFVFLYGIEQYILCIFYIYVFFIFSSPFFSRNSSVLIFSRQVSYLWTHTDYFVNKYLNIINILYYKIAVVFISYSIIWRIHNKNDPDFNQNISGFYDLIWYNYSVI